MSAESVTTTSLPNGVVGDAYSQTLVATGGVAPYSGWTVTVGTLPAGLTLNGATGEIAGTPTTAETQAFTVQVGDSLGRIASQALSITVDAGPAARLAQDCIKKVECIAFEDLGMEAIWRIEVENFPAFIVMDDKGNDFFQELKLG